MECADSPTGKHEANLPRYGDEVCIWCLEEYQPGRNDPIGGIDNGPCSDYAPDSLAPDPADRDVCTTCFYRGSDHTLLGVPPHIPTTDYYDGRDGSIEAEEDDEESIADQEAHREEWQSFLEWQRDMGA